MPQTLTKSVTAYKFSELSSAARSRALEKMYDINVDFDNWHEGCYDYFKEVGKILGIEIDKICCSGFSSQGDGACFEGKYSFKKGCLTKIQSYAPIDHRLHEIAIALTRLQSKYFYGLSARVKHSGHYYHEYCTEIWIQGRGENSTNACQELTELLRDFMKWMYRSLNDEYDYLTSEEAIIETIEANDYDFTEEGNFPAI
jgi:hypothetical protein